MHLLPFPLKRERGPGAELNIGIKPAQDSVLALLQMLQFLVHNFTVFVVIICTERFKMILALLRFGETRRIVFFLRCHLVSIFWESASNFGEFCDCAVGVIP